MAPNKQDASRSSTVLGGLFLEHPFCQAMLSNSTKYLRRHDNGINEGEYLCIEKDGTNLRKYVRVRGLEGQRRLKAGFKMVNINAYSEDKIATDLKTFMTSWLLPEGYPDSVASSYGSYMQWRAFQNIAAVSSTSTRTPIYKAFALKENIGDITAKGESTSNIADLLGTGLGILISGNSKQILPTFFLLSCGYVFSSYQEVKAVILPTMNQERFGVSVRHFLNTGQVPSIYEANSRECIFTFPWPRQMDVELGARVADAFQNSREFLSAKAVFKDKNYLITFNGRRKRAYVLLKEAATSEDVMEGAFQAYMLLHILDRASQKSCKKSGIENIFDHSLYAMDDELLAEGAIGSAIFCSCKNSSARYRMFKEKAAIQGWIVKDSLLNPGSVRLEIS